MPDEERVRMGGRRPHRGWWVPAASTRRGRLLGLATKAALLLGLLLGGCGAPATPTQTGASAASSGGAVPSAASADPTPVPSPSVAPIAWNDCGNGFQCGTVDVPLDYADPAGPVVRLALVRLPATDQAHRLGSLVVNPGGPGGSGVGFVRAGASTLFPSDLRARFDIVGFDPRGVGDSTPVRCIDDLEHFVPLDARAEDAADLADLVAGAKTFAAGCERRNPELLPHLSTPEVARDLDLIRSALGDPKLTYLGFSYGTLIGATYATLFPGRIRAMVLDGALDPSLDLTAVRTGQANGFEAALGRFLADCAADAGCPFRSGGRPGPAFDALMARIDRQPLPTPRLEGREPVNSTIAWLAVTGALYSQGAWPALAVALAEAQAGDGTDLLLMSDPFRGRKPNGAYSNMVDAYAAITCLDFPAAHDVAAYGALADRLSAVAPRFGRLLAFNDIDCAFWPVPATRTPAPATAPGAPPIVVVGSTGDPATPYPWAVSLARQLRGVLVTREGEGHTAYQYSSCVRQAVDAYLLDAAPPAAGLDCH